MLSNMHHISQADGIRPASAFLLAMLDQQFPDGRGGRRSVRRRSGQIQLFLDFALFHDRDAVAQRADHFHLMRDDDERDPELLVDRFQKLQDVLRRLRIEGGRRLVAQQHLRIQDERARWPRAVSARR